MNYLWAKKLTDCFAREFSKLGCVTQVYSALPSLPSTSMILCL